ncbi:MAG: sulfite exporter TauE/SafE family protein [Silicimonas sp.]|nr:sulfite exporter TauE/SafE family protein [Silicimonas sp.]
MASLVAEFGWPTLLAIAVAALVTSSIHGAIGVAGGLLMTAILALLIGVRPSVPIMSVALTISHASRSLMHLQALDRKAYVIVIITSFPFIILTGFIYAMLPVDVLAFILALIIFTAIPMRHWARTREINSGPRVLGSAGAVYGFFAGASIGAGAVLSPFLLGFGLAKEAFVATMAAIAFSTNVVRIGAFTGADLMTSQYLLLGLIVGIIMIPGNYIGRSMLRRLSVVRHGQLVDAMAALGALNFLYLALRS